jgi:putative transcriptional regulator
MNKMKNHIKRYRALNDFTQNDLAIKVGVRRETIVFLEKEKYNPSLELAFKLSKVFNVPIEEIFFFEDEL